MEKRDKFWLRRQRLDSFQSKFWEKCSATWESPPIIPIIKPKNYKIKCRWECWTFKIRFFRQISSCALPRKKKYTNLTITNEKVQSRKTHKITAESENHSVFIYQQRIIKLLQFGFVYGRERSHLHAGNVVEPKPYQVEIAFASSGENYSTISFHFRSMKNIYNIVAHQKPQKFWKLCEVLRRAFLCMLHDDSDYLQVYSTQ